MEEHDKVKIKSLIKVLSKKGYNSLFEDLFYYHVDKKQKLVQFNSITVNYKNSIYTSLLNKIDDPYLLDIFKKEFPIYLLFSNHSEDFNENDLKNIIFNVLNEICDDYNPSRITEFYKKLFIYINNFTYIDGSEHTYSWKTKGISYLKEYIRESENGYLILLSLIFYEKQYLDYFKGIYNTDFSYYVVKEISTEFFTLGNLNEETLLNFISKHIHISLYDIKTCGAISLTSKLYLTLIALTLKNLYIKLLKHDFTKIIDKVTGILIKSNIIQALNNIDKEYLFIFRNVFFMPLTSMKQPFAPFTENYIKKSINKAKLLNA